MTTARKKPPKAEREESRAFSEQVLTNARRTRELAEKALAKLEADERARG